MRISCSYTWNTLYREISPELSSNLSQSALVAPNNPKWVTPQREKKQLPPCGFWLFMDGETFIWSGAEVCTCSEVSGDVKAFSWPGSAHRLVFRFSLAIGAWPAFARFSL
jgi:hypothetical protein